jgi:hypothetical protein
MGTRYFCDRCGEVGDTVGRFRLDPSVSAPHKPKREWLPQFDGELCHVCLEQVRDQIWDALKSKRQ